MDKDTTSDIKQVQRFAMDNSIWMLNMFEKKVDSFISNKSKNVRQKQHEGYLHQKNLIDPTKFFEDPVKTLAKDLTKPIWNCVLKVNPCIYIDEDKVFEYEKTQQKGMTEKIEMNANRLNFSKLLITFIGRFKIEHQDDSSLRLHTIDVHRNSLIKEGSGASEVTQSHMVSCTQSMLLRLKQLYAREVEYLEEMGLEDIQEEYSNLFAQLTLLMPLLDLIIQSKAQTRKQLDWFVHTGTQAIVNMLDSKSGPTLMTVQPKISLINLIVHPLFFCINNALEMQFSYYDKDRYKKCTDINKNIQENQMEQQIYNQNQAQSIKQQGQKKKTPSTIFEDLQFNNCSKIVFLNLDGYQSDLNIDMAKYLCKYVMYISFPKESYLEKQNSDLYSFERFKSERLLEKFYSSQSSKSTKQGALKSLKAIHKLSQREVKKNMFILPIHSKSLSEDQKDSFDVQLYESHFVKFMMEEVILSQIKQFNPSAIVISHSGKINIDLDYWTQLIKKLSVLSNFKVLYYPNKSKMFCFEEFYSEYCDTQTRSQGIDLGCQMDYVENEQKYYEAYEKAKIDVFEGTPLADGINMTQLETSFLDKISVFLKVSSGTYTLSKKVQEDSHIEKYKNYKVMGYSAQLLRLLGKKFPSIEKIKMRTVQYETIYKVLKNSYVNRTQTFDKMFDKTISKYHHKLIKILEKALLDDLDTLSQNEIICLQGCQFLIKAFRQSNSPKQVKQKWQDFRFQYCLELATEKTESRVYLHIPKFKPNSGQARKKTLEDVISAEFQIQVEKNKEKLPVELSSDSKIYYSQSRNCKEALIYITNYIPMLKEDKYYNFYGVLNQAIDQRPEGKISLKLVQFHASQSLKEFQHMVSFNYYETESFIFMFWPKIHNNVKEKLLKLKGQRYVADISNFIFRASRNDPGNMYEMARVNETSKYVLPRSGCTCYEVPGSNKIHIFGGFYSNTDNYMKFQTDISIIVFENVPQSRSVTLQNVPKSFYIEFQKIAPSKSGQKIMQEQQVEGQLYQTTEIKKFKNDFVRPRIEYQVFLTEDEKQKQSIFLIGGVGEKFTRPYSLLWNAAHKIQFDSQGIIESVKRILTPKPLPANLSKPTKSRAEQMMNKVKNAQNRSIHLYEGLSSAGTLVSSQHQYIYDSVEERFDWERAYEFADSERLSEREQTGQLRKPAAEFPLKYELRACNFRGREFHSNLVTVMSEGGRKHVFELQLELSTEVRTYQPSLARTVKLTGASIVSLDINAALLYCVVRHPVHTLGRCILAHFDIAELAEKTADLAKVELTLRQVHRFEQDVSRNVIVVASSSIIAVLHGYSLGQIALPEMVLKKQKNGQIRTLPVSPCEQPSSILSVQELLSTPLTNALSCSFFINQNNGNMTCMTLKSLARSKDAQGTLFQTIYVRIQELKMAAKEDHRWKFKFQKLYRFSIELKSTHNQPVQATQNTSVPPLLVKNDCIKLLEVKPNKQSKQTKEKEFYLKAEHCGKVYYAMLLIESNTDLVPFYDCQLTIDQYELQLLTESKKQESVLLEKPLYFYESAYQQRPHIIDEEMK